MLWIANLPRTVRFCLYPVRRVWGFSITELFLTCNQKMRVQFSQAPFCMSHTVAWASCELYEKKTSKEEYKLMLAVLLLLLDRIRAGRLDCAYKIY
jgi:hypothetical protein